MTAALRSLEETRGVVAQLRAAGSSVVPLRNWGDAKNRKAPRQEKGWQRKEYTEDDWEIGEHIGEKLGKQRSGRYRYVVDIDSHTPEQNAEQYLRSIEQQISASLNNKLAKALSTSRRGRYLVFETTSPIPNGTIHDQRGYKAGEFLGEGRQVVYIEDDRWLSRNRQTICPLRDDEVSELLAALNYTRASTPSQQDTQPSSEDSPLVHYWYEHAHELEDKDGAPKALGQGISRRLLTGQAPITNASEARYIVMLQMYRVGYTDEQILGYTLRRCDWNRYGWKLHDDCARILNKLKATVPRRISEAARKRDARVKGGGNINYVRDDSPPRTPGRPVQRTTVYGKDVSTTSARLLHILCELRVGTSCLATNDELAQALDRTIQTVRRCLDELVAAGLIQKQYLVRETGSVRVLHFLFEREGVTETPAASFAETCTKVQPIAPKRETPPALEETRVSSPPGAKPAKVSLRDTLMALRAGGVKDRRQLRRYGLDQSWAWADVLACWQEVLQAEKRQRMLDAIRTMKVWQLRKATQRAEDRASESVQRGDNAWKFWLVYRNCCERELKRRIAEGKAKQSNQQAPNKQLSCMLPPVEPDPPSVLVPRATAEEKQRAQALQRELATKLSLEESSSEAEGPAPSAPACFLPPTPKRVFGLGGDDLWWKQVAFERAYYLERGDMAQVARCEEILQGCVSEGGG